MDTSAATRDPSEESGSPSSVSAATFNPDDSAKDGQLEPQLDAGGNEMKSMDNNRKTLEVEGASADVVIEDTEKVVPDPPPDGGWQAWTVTCAAFFLSFASMGLRDAIGVYQRWDETASYDYSKD